MKTIFAGRNCSPGRDTGVYCRTGSAQDCGVLYGVQSLWLFDRFPEAALPAGFESAIPILTAVATCLFLLWNFILRKRLTRYRQYASNQGERYRQFFENCPDALLIVEHEGSIVSANPHACKLLNTDGQELLAQTVWHFIDPVSRIELHKKFDLCLTGKPMQCNAGIMNSDGSVTPVEMNGCLHRIKGKRLVQLYVRDLSVLREVEEQVRSLYTQLEQVTVELEEKERMIPEQTQLAREELIAFVNHRIRTPLDGIMGMGQLLADTPLNIEQYNCVRTILQSSSSLLNVIRSMGQSPEHLLEDLALQAEFVDLRAICDQLYRRYQPLAAQKGIELRCDCQSSVPQQVVSDGMQLGQVLTDLLDHAVKSTMQGLVMLNIECRRNSGDDAEIYFQVIDTGPGIDEESHFRAKETSAHAEESRFARGPDLAGCRRVVEQMGGNIGQTRTAGKGSTYYFDLTLPLALPRPEHGADQQPPDEAPSTSPILDAQVLVVDDNRISQKVVVAMLYKAGCRVDVAGNGKEALSQIHKKDYDVVLMDCQMPVMDGHEATMAIRSMPEPYRSLPVVALTAHSLKHELQACLDSGMNDCMVKPIERQKLIETVAKHVKQDRVNTVMVKAS